VSKGRSKMTTIRDIMQVGVGMPDRENFTRDILGIPVSRSARATIFSAESATLDELSRPQSNSFEFT
ncbi:MAG: hypothetical protein ACREP3_19445, partial [Candidatus Binatia bacterium]